MATKQFYATGTFKYQHRMLKAGDPVEMDGPTSRLYTHLGKIADRRPRAAPVVSEFATAPTEAPKPRAKRTRKKK